MNPLFCSIRHSVSPYNACSMLAQFQHYLKFNPSLFFILTVPLKPHRKHRPMLVALRCDAPLMQIYNVLGNGESDA